MNNPLVQHVISAAWVRLTEALQQDTTQINDPGTAGGDDTPLMEAVTRKNNLCAGILLGYEAANVNLTNTKGETPLMVAIKNDDTKIVNILLRRKDIDLSIQDQNGNTALQLAVDLCKRKIINMLAARYGIGPIDDLLVDPEDDAKMNVNDINEAGFTLLGHAIVLNFMEKINLFIDLGADKNARGSEVKEDTSQSYRTPLELAILCRHADIVSLLLERDVEKNTKNALDETPLMIAVQEGNIEIVKLLVDAGVDKSILDHVGQSVYDRIEDSTYKTEMIEKGMMPQYVQLRRLMQMPEETFNGHDKPVAPKPKAIKAKPTAKSTTAGDMTGAGELKCSDSSAFSPPKGKRM
jgi:uncharacterized protein